MIRITATLLIICALGAGAYMCFDTWTYFNLPPEKKMQRLWEEDMVALTDAKMLPPAWQSIREVKWTTADEATMKVAKKLTVPVKIKEDGEYRLEIIFAPWSEEGKLGAYLQYDVVEIKSQNTVWEKSRTLILSDSNSWVDKTLNGKMEKDLEKELFQ